MDLHDLVAEKLKKINANKESIIEAWVAQTGISPEFAVMVQQEKDGVTRFWVETRTDRCLTHRNAISELRAELCNFLNAFDTYHEIRLDHLRSDPIVADARHALFSAAIQARHLLKCRDVD